MATIEARNYKGTRDWMTSDTIIRQEATATLRKVFEQFGFEPLETPIVELQGVLKGKYGQEGDELMYFFEKGGEAIGLRYDQTVPLARVVTQHESELVLPYRRYTMGPVFRADTPQKGRFRQFTQCDFDVVGVSSPIADAEVVALNFTALSRLGFQKFEVQICDRKLLNGMAQALGATDQSMVMAILRSWDKVEKASADQITEELKAEKVPADVIARFLDVTGNLRGLSGSEVLPGVRRLFPNQPLVEEGTTVLEQLLGYVEDFGIPKGFYVVNPCLARGLSYYTGPIFETVVKEGGVGSITGGGRYDNLIAAMGGPNLPATGSSFGLERVLSVMETLGITKAKKTATQIFVATFNPKVRELIDNAIKLTAELRSAGFSVELYMGEESIGKQLQLADRRGIPIAAFAGTNEMQRGTVVIKNLAAPMTVKDKTVNQWEVARAEVASKVREVL